LSATSLASTALARGIRVDSGMVCATNTAMTACLPAVATSPGSISNLGGTAAITANPGLGAGYSVWSFVDTSPDATLTPLNFNPATSVLYVWIPNSGPNAVIPVPSDELSGLTGNNPASVQAMVNVLQITSSAYANDYEVQINYPDFGVPCPLTASSSAPTLTWAGKTYTFAGNPINACNTPNDFLFNSQGRLIGGGWTVQLSVPEPGTLALALTGIPLLLRIRRRKS
jgi:hypothetical protein